MSRRRAIDFRTESRMIVKQLYPGKTYKAIREKALLLIDSARTDSEIIRALHTIREEV